MDGKQRNNWNADSSRQTIEHRFTIVNFQAITRLDASAGSSQAERRGIDRADLARAESSIPTTPDHSREAADGVVASSRVSGLLALEIARVGHEGPELAVNCASSSGR